MVIALVVAVLFTAGRVRLAGAEAQMMRGFRRRLLSWLRLVLVVVVVFYTLFPFYWAVVSSLKTGSALFDASLLPLLPASTTTGRVPGAAFRPQHPQLVRRGLSTVAISLFVALTAAYALGRVRSAAAIRCCW
jgi:trehalose/maltose transport system permease protein